jgi:N-acetylglutamate synthase-like GNAT family acetyltransferase
MIRRFNNKDAERCSEFVKKCLLVGPDLIEKTRKKLISETTPSALRRNEKNVEYLVWDEEGKVVGIGGLKGTRIVNMYVDIPFQNRKIGTLLCKAIEDLAKRNKVKTLNLTTHPKALQFYTRQGFYIVREFESEGARGIYMEKSLSNKC